MYIFGAAGHAKVIIELLEETKEPIDGIFDDDSTKKEIFNYALSHYESNPQKQIIIAIGDNQKRLEVAERISKDYQFRNAISNKANISKRVEIQEGTVVMNGVNINSGTKIGKHCIINTAASIDHDCKLGNFIHISPNATLCGGICIEDNAHIGAGAVILPNIKIGKNAIIGAGAVVTKNIAPDMVVVGNPARELKK